MKGLKLGKNVQVLSDELQIAKATAEVYGIDCMVAGQDIDHQTVAMYMGINAESFEIIKNKILKVEDKKLCAVKDQLREAFSYNQIRFVLACLIQDLDL